MKIAIKKFLHKRGLYYPLKYSRLFNVYQQLFKRTAIKQQGREVDFYKSFLPSCKLIFDIGANDGHKTEAFLALSEKVVCCEPDRENFKILQTRFRHKKHRVVLVNKALSDQDGIAEMHLHHPGSAFNTLSEKWKKLLEADQEQRWNERITFAATVTVETTTLDRLIEKYGVPDYIKIDVEGFEQNVLKGLHHRVSYLSFETLLPDYANEMKICLSHLSNLSNGAMFNIARDEKLVFPQFIPKAALEEWLNDYRDAAGFEIVIKMST